MWKFCCFFVVVNKLEKTSGLKTVISKQKFMPIFLLCLWKCVLDVFLVCVSVKLGDCHEVAGTAASSAGCLEIHLCSFRRRKERRSDRFRVTRNEKWGCMCWRVSPEGSSHLSHGLKLLSVFPGNLLKYFQSIYSTYLFNTQSKFHFR